MEIISVYYYISAILLLSLSSIPLVIYLRYGREPKINYGGEYEVDFPTDDPPAIVNAMCGSGLSKKVGEPDINGFIATIMDLIDRNYLLIKDAPYESVDSASDSLFLEINPDYDPDTLWGFELEILNFLQEYEQDGIISMDLVSESLNYYDGADAFKYTYKNWENEVKQTLLDSGSLKESFLSKGDKYIKIFGLLGLITVIIVLFAALSIWAVVYIGYVFLLYTISLKTKNIRMMVYGIGGLMGLSTYLFSIISSSLLPVKALFLSSIILGVISIVSLMLPQKIAGQWTKYGREYYTRWHSFKKYIQDYSLMKEYSPKSVNIWDRYLVYATALGIAEEVKKSVKFSIPYEQLKGSNLYSFQYYSDPISIMKNAVETALDPD